MAHFLNMAPQNVALYVGAGALLTAVHYHSVSLSCGYKNRIDPPPSPPAPIISHVPHVPSPNVPVPDIFGHPNTLSYSVAIHPRRYTLPKQHLIVENATSLVANDSSELMIGNQLYASPLPGASTVLIISALLLVLFFFLKCLRGKRIGASQRQIVWLNARLEEMQAELTAAVKESLVFEQNYLASQVEIDQLVSHERELQSQLHHLRLEKENQSAKVPQLWEKPDPSNKQRNSLVEQKQLETDNQDLKAINGKVSGERDRLAARVKHLEQALTIANDKVDELNTNAKNNSKELQKAVSKYNLSCQRFKEFQEARSMMGKEMERLETSQYEDGQRIDELKSEAKLTAMEIQKYQSQLLDKDTDLATLSKEKKNLERNFAEQLTAAKLASAAKLEAVEQHARTALETFAKAKDNEIKSLQKKLYAGSEAASRREQDHQTRLEMMSKEKDAEKANELSAVKQLAKEISGQKLLKVNEEHRSALTNLEARLLKEFAGKQSAEKETERSLLKMNEEQVTTVSNLGADLENSKEKLDAVRNAHQELLSELLKSLQNARNQARNPSIQKEVLEKTIETVIKQLKNAEEQLAELVAEDLESGSAEDNSGDGNSGDKYGSGNGGDGDSDDDQDDGNSSRVKKDVTTGSEEKRHHAGSSYESTKVDSKSASDSHGVLANEPPKNVGSSLDPAGAVDVSASGNSKDSAKSTNVHPPVTEQPP
ncbi:hypothetical protein BKA66DRAFT_12422 [Pyrenochaeta sp. MPI-SDFR-AT-0127]|nr:hypothetical protein BKA66DRAFT_12422 [Pyrenochaeta sp. MPI-SDFR-AT-0127]